MALFKMVSIFALFCVIGFSIGEETMTVENAFEVDIREACRNEFNVTMIDWDKKAEDQPSNVQCYFKCLLVKNAQKQNANTDFAATIKAIEVPEPVQKHLEKCKVLVKDESCLAFSSFMQCVAEYKP